MATSALTRAKSTPAKSDHRWLVLVVVSIAQLMVVLDATIVNIALPSAQAALGFDNSQRQWIITAYALAFGSLLLLGGRVGDIVGRKRTFLIALVAFAAASALGGAAPSFAVLVTARALQGAAGAMLAPAALGTLVTTFQNPQDRGKAFGVFGTVAVAGGAVGLILGGVLTQVPVVALVHVRQRAVRRGRRRWCADLHDRDEVADPAQRRPGRHRARVLGSVQSGIRLLAGRDPRLDLGRDDRVAGAGRNDAGGVRASRAASGPTPASARAW